MGQLILEEHTDAIKADQDSVNAAPIFTSATDPGDKTMKAAADEHVRHIFSVIGQLS